MVDEADTLRGTSAVCLRLTANALRYEIAPIRETGAFARMRHDADLLPAIRLKLSVLLEPVHRDSQLTYDIQGLRDQGTDILIRLDSPVHDSEYICFQVKSHIELGNESVANKLLVQYNESIDHFAPLRYFILLACDLSDRSRQRTVRAIQSAFKKKSDVTVVDPQYLARFLRLQLHQMDALLTNVMRIGDPMVTEARASVSAGSASESALILALVTLFVDLGTWPDQVVLWRFDWFAKALCVLRVGSPGWPEDDDDDDDDDDGTENVRNSLRQEFPEGDYAIFQEKIVLLLDDASEVVDIRDDGTICLSVQHYRALLGLTCEAAVKYELAGVALLSYLIEMLFP